MTDKYSVSSNLVTVENGIVWARDESGIEKAATNGQCADEIERLGAALKIIAEQGGDITEPWSAEKARQAIYSSAVETSAPRALAFGDEVTYTPLYGGTKLPREGWKIEMLPKLTYVIKHPNGSLIAVDAGEISAVEPTVRCTCFEDEHGPDCNIDGCCGQCKGSQVNGT